MIKTKISHLFSTVDQSFTHLKSKKKRYLMDSGDEKVEIENY